MPGLPIGSQSRLQRRTAVSAEINPLLRVKKKERAAVSAEGLPSADGKKKKAPAFAGAERCYANTV